MSFIHRCGDGPDAPIFLVLATSEKELENYAHVLAKLSPMLDELTKPHGYIFVPTVLMGRLDLLEKAMK